MSLHRKPKSQQAFLLEAMQRMEMDPDQFARRLGASRRRLDDWLKRTGEPGSIEHKVVARAEPCVLQR
ncbi:MAG: hypothetical protein RJB37_1227, partial [Pseudomonadota bacterium]